MAKLYSIKALQPFLPLASTVAPLSYFFYPMGGGDGGGWMFRYVVDSKGFWLQKNDKYMSPYENGFNSSEIAGTSGLDIDVLELVPFESNALQHSEAQRHPFRYGLPGGEPILPLPFTARQFFDWEKQCLQDELIGGNKSVFRHLFFYDDECLLALEKSNPDAAELARIIFSGVRPEQQHATPLAAPVGAVGHTRDPERRLARLRELGGTAKYAHHEWKFTGMSCLVNSEKADGRKRCSEKTIRADLIQAAQAERDEKTAGFGAGLGQR